MKFVAIDKKTSYEPTRDGIDAYHATLFHGRVTNKEVDDNHLGDTLRIPLEIEKNAYDLRYVIQPQRNLIIPEGARTSLAGIGNVAFFPVVFTKLFFVPYRTGDFSLGPESYDQLEAWLDSFQHEERLRREIDRFYELILPNYARIKQEFSDICEVEFNLVGWRNTRLALSKSLLSRYPVVWTPECIVFREDAFGLVEESFCWKYFHKEVGRLRT